MGASAITWETRAGGCWPRLGTRLFFYAAHAEDTRGERLFEPETQNPKPRKPLNFGSLPRNTASLRQKSAPPPSPPSKVQGFFFFSFPLSSFLFPLHLPPKSEILPHSGQKLFTPKYLP